MNKTLYANVSVIVPYYNSHKTIERAVKSVAGQTFKPREIIIIDDGSERKNNQTTLKRIKNLYSDHIKFFIIKLKKNQGVSYARNYGWALAKYPYVAFLDADDAWHPKKLEIQYSFMKKNPSVLICGHEHKTLSGTDRKLNWIVDKWQSIFISKWEMILSNRFITPSVMIKRSVSDRFKSDQRHMEDHRLWIDIICTSGPAAKILTPLAAIYKNSFGEGGLSGQLWLMETADLKNMIYFCRAGYINQIQCLGLIGYSVIKYLRRILKSFFI